VLTMESMEIGENELQTHTIQARFVSDTGEEAGPPIDLPIQVDVQQLELICNALLKNVCKLTNILVNLHFNTIIPFRTTQHHISSS
jgi:NLE (NUC135) domain